MIFTRPAKSQQSIVTFPGTNGAENEVEDMCTPSVCCCPLLVALFVMLVTIVVLPALPIQEKRGWVST